MTQYTAVNRLLRTHLAFNNTLGLFMAEDTHLTRSLTGVCKSEVKHSMTPIR
jgi:hypothetical protein